MSRIAHTRRRSLVLGTFVLVAVLSGCAAASTTSSGEVGSAVEDAVNDVVTCEAFGDVSTIIANADIALSEGRMEAQERDGWYRLATRVLDRVPTTGSGSVHDAIHALQVAAPAVKLGAIEDVDFRSLEWANGQSALMEACAAEGVDLAIEGFTGG